MHLRLYFQSLEGGKYERVTAITLGLSYDVSGFDQFGYPRDRVEMLIECMSYFEANFDTRHLSREEVEKRMGEIQTQMMLSVKVMASAYSINAPFDFDRKPRSMPLAEPPPIVKEAFREADRVMMNEMLKHCKTLSFYENVVFKHDKIGKFKGVDWDGGISVGQVPTLENMCLRKLSWYNRVYTGDKLGAYTFNASDNLYPNKLVNVYSKLDVQTSKFDIPLLVTKSIQRGMHSMYDAMGMKKHFGTIDWEFHPDDVMKMVLPTNSSAGIRPGDVRSVAVGHNLNYVFTPYGTKTDQAFVCAGRFVEAYENYLTTDRFELTDRSYSACTKSEAMKCESLDPKVRAKATEKTRIFYMQSMMGYMLANIVHGHRKVERGSVIKIGQRWWRGGAYVFAKQNLYDDPEMRYDDGDISGLDYHMLRPLIEMFSMASLFYISKDSRHYKLYLQMLELCTKNLSVKELHLFARLWILLIGKIPSGAYETSMADSWYVALSFFSFVWYMIYTNPAFAEKIIIELEANRIPFPVYGDDHFIGRRRIIQQWINESLYGEFLKANFRMEIRGGREGLLYLSVPDGNGELSYEGVVFCQKYSIARPKFMPEGCAPVVPYRKMSAVMYKLGYGSRDRFTTADYLVAIISSAYDGFGTNLPLYKYQRNLYEYLFARAGYKSIVDVIADYQSQTEAHFDLTKISRKIGVAKETIFQGFPSLEVLWNMHVLDEVYCNFTVPVRQYSVTTGVYDDEYKI